MTRQQHYIDDRGAAALKAYKYKGEDRSYYYRYILTPMNIRLIELIPVWLAPNVITLLGLGITVIAHILTALYSPDFTSEIPSWLCVLSAICIFSYQTLDNLDGRQARRTGSSSPLGMLFDHGVDALNCTVGAVMVATVLQMGSTPMAWGLWITVITAFFFATWEEFYTDELILPEINGPSDGQLITMGLLLTGAAWPGIWGTPIQEVPKFASVLQSLGAPADVWGLKMHALVLGLSIFCLVPTVLSNMRNVYLKGSHSFAASLLTLLPFLALEVVSGLWLFYSPSNVFASHPRTFLIGMGFLFGQLAAKLMLAHLTNSPYNPLRLSLLPLLVFASLFVWPSARAVAAPFLPNISEDFALVLCAGLACAAWLHFVVYTIQDMTSILDIACFRIRPKPIHPPASVAVSRSPSPPASLTVAANGRLKGGKQT